MSDPFDRAVAREKLERRERRAHRARAGFRHHLKVYVAVNVLLIAIWLLGNDADDFWPAWSILGWGIGLYFHWGGVRQRERRVHELRGDIDGS